MNIFSRTLRFFVKPRVRYQPLITVRVYRDALLHNIRQYRQAHPSSLPAPVLKSNAYGHGLVETARALSGEPVPFFVLDSFYEALTLRQHGIFTPIVVIGFERTDTLLTRPLDKCTPTIISMQTLQEVVHQLKRPLPFHLKIDTGMHRQGILYSEIPAAIALIRSNKNFLLEGLCSHFADADGADQQFTLKQISLWNEAVAAFKKNISGIRFFHISNTAGSFFSGKADANVGRLGVGLYGINPSPHDRLDLQPALEMVSVISSVKEISAGEKVGYGVTFEAKKNIRIATVPVGYNEGVDRRLSGRGGYGVLRQFCPLVGRVSMNISSIDVSSIPSVQIGDEVTVISRNPQDKNSVEQIALLCGCIPYEILVGIPGYLRRTVV